MLDNIFNLFSERRAIQKDNVASFGSIKSEVTVRYPNSVVYKTWTYNLKLPAFMYTHRENVQKQSKTEKQEKI